MARSTTNALIAILGVAVLGSAVAVTTNAARTSDYAFYDPIVDVHTMIDRLYVEAPDRDGLQRGAIQGMIDELNDPYTAFVPARDEPDFNKNLTGEYVGIGAEVIMDQGWLKIVSPMDDSPAWRAGVMAEDRVVSIEGNETQGLTIDECIELLMGEPGTEVTITVEREGEQLGIDIVRDHIKVQAVKGFMREDAGEGAWRHLIDQNLGVAYVRLTQFTPGSSEEVAAAIEHATGRAQGELGGLILDLRDNPGGLLDEAVDIADLFLESGVIVSTQGRSAQGRTERATSAGTLPAFPLVVLVNGASASASEVLSGALRDHDRAVVIGSRTFGKGSVQSVRPLESGAGVLKLTEQYYTLPSGRVIHRRDDSRTWGVDPSDGYYLPLSSDERVAMLTARREQEVIHEMEPVDFADTESVLGRLEDPQLTAAVRVMGHRIETGAFEPVGIEQGGADAIAYDELNALRLAEERIMRQLGRIDRRIDAIEQGVDARADPLDLWDDEIALDGGTLVVRAPDGSVVAELEITGSDLERWLIDADVRPRSSEENADAETDGDGSGG